MKKLLCIILCAMLLFTACSEYAEPDVSELMSEITSGQEIAETAYCDEATAEAVFGLDFDKVEDFSCAYSGKGGYADIAAVFKFTDSDYVSEAEKILSDYKDARYHDFEGYAPFEAEKIENGVILTYGRYVVLLILGDISAAVDTVDAAFKA